MSINHFEINSCDVNATMADNEMPFSWVNLENTTFAHQLATYVAFNSPLQFIVDHGNILLHDTLIGQAHDFINQVPKVWSQTVVLPQTEVGEITVVARRSGSDWYFYVLNGIDIKKTIAINIADIVMNYSTMNFVLYLDDLEFESVIIGGLNGGLQSSAITKTVVLPFIKLVMPAQAVLTFDVAPKGGAVVCLKV